MCPNVIDIPFAIAGIYILSQNVMGLRSTDFDLLVNAFIKICFIRSGAPSSTHIPSVRKRKSIFLTSIRQLFPLHFISRPHFLRPQAASNSSMSASATPKDFVEAASTRFSSFVPFVPLGYPSVRSANDSDEEE